jgi:hypothetical protein
MLGKLWKFLDHETDLNCYAVEFEGFREEAHPPYPQPKIVHLPRKVTRMMQLMVGEVSAKLQFVLDDPSLAVAKAHISSSGAGRSELPPLREDD